MKNPTILQETRDLECSKFGLTEEQYLTLHSKLSGFDRDRLEYFQDVNLSDAEANILRIAPHEYLNVNGNNEIQICADLFSSLVEYDEQIYFVEHDDDPIQELGIDIETYSSVDLTETGVYPYAEADDFEILLFAYSINGSPVRVVDLASGESLPLRIKAALTDKNVLKTAYNAAFERVCLSKYLGVWLNPEEWDCTMVRAARLALPLSLGQCALVLGLAEKKMTEGKALINFFSKPCKPTIRNGQRTRNLPEHAPDKWSVFKKYNKRDVEVEQAIRRKVVRLDITETERKAWLLDQQINDRGVLVDMQLANKASMMDDEYRANLVEEAKRITGLENPNSVTQLKEWLKAETGLVFPACDKETVKAMLPRMTSTRARRVLQIRQELGKTSTAKYKAMLKCACKDNRVRGLFQFYGANRTGRFCLTGDHEVLTDNGWVRLDEWRGGKIACWNMNTEVISFQKAIPNEFDYRGEMYHACNKRCDIICTPNHKIPYWTEEGWKADEMQNLVKRHSIPFWGLRQNTITHNCDTELRVLIMVQADGHYTEEGTLNLHFTKQRKIERCTKLLRKAGLVFIRKTNSDKSTTFSINWKHLPLYLREFNKKNFGSWILKENADTFFDELQYWDGYRSSPNSMQFVTTNKINADLIQALGLINGKSVTMLIKEPKQDRDTTKDRANTAYVLNVWDNPGHHSTIRIEDISKEQFSGKVYCPTTPTGFFLVRRNGKCWVTGNSGKLVQLQNLPQNHLPDLDDARNLVKYGDLDEVEMVYGNVPQTLSELIRTAFIAKEGCTYHVCDFSAIEARVIAWLAGADWVLDVFRKGGDIYCATASQMFGVPVEKHGRNAELRQKGKISVLALGYGGGVNALVAMGGDKMGLTEYEMNDIVQKWRKANPRIVRLWKHCEQAARYVINTRESTVIEKNIKFEYKWGGMCITLPSKRQLFYPRMHVNANDRLEFEGLNQEKKTWGRIETYGGRLTENIIQAIARDCLVETMLRLDAAGYKIVFHIHDETVIEATPNQKLEDIAAIFGEEISWAKGLPLKGAGYTTPYYLKD